MSKTTQSFQCFVFWELSHTMWPNYLPCGSLAIWWDYYLKKEEGSCEPIDDRKHGKPSFMHALSLSGSFSLSLSPSLYSSLHSQQIALRLIKLLQQSSHLGTGPGLRSMPHALLTLSALPSARPIKPLVPLKSCLPPLTLVIGNENKVEGFPQTKEGNSLF